VLRNIFSHGLEKIKIIAPVLKAFHETMTNLEELKKKASRNKEASDILIRLENETTRLLPVNFMQLYEPGRLLHIPRYLQTVSVRARRGIIEPEKEKARSRELEIHTASLDKLLKSLTPLVSEEKKKAIEEYFWLIEEYKVSLFAQELKTPVPISAKRLDKKLKEIERMV
ncbi:MAG: DUF3418 domain-containing protein, partial [Desulfobacterales bacterium]|nr:DUF3418 domain-containing protein [Desulfobacterales bacterium]